ncbi:hypothetical protein JHK87_039320 [Glycine soja]|nr:hypothetical protein JHK87_039320 [Glycine soja]
MDDSVSIGGSGISCGGDNDSGSSSTSGDGGDNANGNGDGGCGCTSGGDDALVIKLLGKNIGLQLMKEKLTRLWKLGSGFEMLHIGNGYFTVKFDSKEDRTKVIQEGPWIIFDHYLMVKTWTRNSVFPKAKIQKTMNVIHKDKTKGAINTPAPKLNAKWCCTTLYASSANFESTLTPNAESAPTPTPTLTTTQSAPTPCVDEATKLHELLTHIRVASPPRFEEVKYEICLPFVYNRL